MTVFCTYCGEGWPRDPALEVSCPSCGRGPGRRCVRPSGHECDIHADRDRRAMDEGWIKPCSTLSARPEPPAAKRLVCEGSQAVQLGLF